MISSEASPKYTTELSKGQGAVSETLALLQLYEPNMAANTLAKTALSAGTLSHSTAIRSRDMVQRVFARRYLVDDGAPAKYLKYLTENKADSAVVHQLMLVYTARAHPILADYISDVYWGLYAAGVDITSRQHAEEFIQKIHEAGLVSPPWSETMRIRVARYLLGTLADFGLVGNTRQSMKPIRSYSVLPETVLFLAHEIHFKGYSDNSIIDSPDWKLFGLVKSDVAGQLELVARQGHFVVQNSGELLRITWRYNNMRECLDAITG